MVIEAASDHAPPRLVLFGVGAAHAATLGVTRTHLTITHDGGVAAAVVILEAVPALEVP
jgi:holo-[acyl-carrier protein] synthase